MTTIKHSRPLSLVPDTLAGFASQAGAEAYLLSTDVGDVDAVWVHGVVHIDLDGDVLHYGYIDFHDMPATVDKMIAEHQND